MFPPWAPFFFARQGHAGCASRRAKNSLHNALRRRGAMGGARQGRREPSYAGIWGRPRTPHRVVQRGPGGSRLIVKRVLSPAPAANGSDPRRWRPIAATMSDGCEGRPQRLDDVLLVVTIEARVER